MEIVQGYAILKTTTFDSGHGFALGHNPGAPDPFVTWQDVYKRQVAIYAVLIQSIATDGDPIGAIWGCVGYTVLLCFTLFKTGSLAKSIFGCH